DDVLATEVFNAFLRFVACAFTDGEHRDNRAHAEDDSQCGQERAQSVKPKASDTEADGPFQAGRFEAVNHLRMSLSIWPSQSRIARYERSATFWSCVTRISVLPC